MTYRHFKVIIDRAETQKKGEMKVEVWGRDDCDPTRARNDLLLPLANQNLYNWSFPLGRGPFLSPLCNGLASTEGTRDDTNNEADLFSPLILFSLSPKASS